MATEVCRQILATVDRTKYQIQTLCSLDDLDRSGYEWIETHFGLIANENRGVAANKNRLLVHFRNCDLVFIAEDDISFLKEGWIDLYQKAVEETGYQHFNFIVSDYCKGISTIDTFGQTRLGHCQNLSGVLMVFTKACIRKVGGFNLLFKGYGYEHVDYTKRSILAKLHPPHYCHLMEASNFISWSSTPSTLSEEAKDHYLEKNKQLYIKRIPFSYLPLSPLWQKAYHLASGPMRFLLKVNKLVNY